MILLVVVVQESHFSRCCPEPSAMTELRYKCLPTMNYVPLRGVDSICVLDCPNKPENWRIPRFLRPTLL